MTHSSASPAETAELAIWARGASLSGEQRVWVWQSVRYMVCLQVWDENGGPM